MLAIKIDLREKGKAIITIMVRGYTSEIINYYGENITAGFNAYSRILLTIDNNNVADFPSDITCVLRPTKDEKNTN